MLGHPGRILRFPIPRSHVSCTQLFISLRIEIIFFRCDFIKFCTIVSMPSVLFPYIIGKDFIVEFGNLLTFLFTWATVIGLTCCFWYLDRVTCPYGPRRNVPTLIFTGATVINLTYIFDILTCLLVRVFRREFSLRFISRPALLSVGLLPAAGLQDPVVRRTAILFNLLGAGCTWSGICYVSVALDYLSFACFFLFASLKIIASWPIQFPCTIETILLSFLMDYKMVSSSTSKPESGIAAFIYWYDIPRPMKGANFDRASFLPAIANILRESLFADSVGTGMVAPAWHFPLCISMLFKVAFLRLNQLDYLEFRPFRGSASFIDAEFWPISSCY